MNPIPPGNDDRVWQQMLAYLDGTAPSGEVRLLNDRLKQDAELRAAFGELLLRETQLKELGQEVAAAGDETAARCEVPENVVPLARMPDRPEAADPRQSPVPPPRRGWRPLRTSTFRSGLALAATLVLLGVVTWSWWQPEKVARLGLVEGNLTIQRGDRKFAAKAGDALRPGDRLQTQLNSRALFQYLGEATEVQVEAVTDLRLEAVNGSKLLRLAQGTLEATVAPQKPGAPLRLISSQTEGAVVGTRFKFLATDAATRLEVFEGAVSILQSLEGPSLLVKAGQGATVVPGQPVILQNLSESRGTILLEHWDGAAGTNQTYLGQFMFSGVGVKPGSSRARGYLHPPRSGAYSFHVAGSGQTELWLSDSADPSGARKVWSSSETNAPAVVAQLRTDQRYYLELRCTSQTDPAAFTLSWTTPGGQQRVIYGDFLSPFDPGAAP